MLSTVKIILCTTYALRHAECTYLLYSDHQSSPQCTCMIQGKHMYHHLHNVGYTQVQKRYVSSC